MKPAPVLTRSNISLMAATVNPGHRAGPGARRNESYVLALGPISGNHAGDADRHVNSTYRANSQAVTSSGSPGALVS